MDWLESANVERRTPLSVNKLLSVGMRAAVVQRNDS